MILPNKYLGREKALLWIGAEALQLLKHPKTVSRLWNDMKRTRDEMGIPPLTYDWFILVLDLLFVLGTIEFEQGRLRQARR